MTKMMCNNCNEEILSANVKLCPYCHSTNLVSKKELIPSKLSKIVKLEKGGHYAEAAREYETLEMPEKANKCRRLAVEEAIKLEKTGRYKLAARLYEDLEMWEKACKIRRLERKGHVLPKDVKVGSVSLISMCCPYCNTSQPIASKSNQVACSNCKKKYAIPKKVLDLIQ
ncbi:hypothetical protein JJE00_05745 [Candidatus Bathyarchaeota archaeon]|nr:hypothetical protein [Candidatus Bathyarchaeota archaeon]